jgi:hypothetical protein
VALANSVLRRQWSAKLNVECRVNACKPGNVMPLTYEEALLFPQLTWWSFDQIYDKIAFGSRQEQEDLM